MRRFFISVLPHKNLSILYVGCAGSCYSCSATIPFLLITWDFFKATTFLENVANLRERLFFSMSNLTCRIVRIRLSGQLRSRLIYLQILSATYVAETA